MLRMASASLHEAYLQQIKHRFYILCLRPGVGGRKVLEWYEAVALNKTKNKK